MSSSVPAPCSPRKGLPPDDPKLTRSVSSAFDLAGAGFYLNATSEKYKKHYNMYDLITKEIPAVISEEGLPIVRLFCIGAGDAEPAASKLT